MEFLQPYINMWKNYAVFSGRSGRRDYWMAQLVNIIVSFILGILSGFADFFLILVGLYSLALIVPSLSLTWRRLHDIGKSGGWFFISFVPAVGGIILLVFTCMDSQPGMNAYGPNPKGM